MANEISKIKLPGSTTEYTVKDNSAITNITRSGTTFTATKRDGTTFVFTQQDNNTTYTLAVGTGDDANKIVLTPSSGTANKITVPYATSTGSVSVSTISESGFYKIPFLKNNQFLQHENFECYFKSGTTSEIGTSRIRLGNDMASGTEGNSGGMLELCSFGGKGWSMLTLAETDGHPSHVLPAQSGTIGVFTATPTSGQVVVTDGTAGGFKTTGYTIAKSVPSNAVFTDTTYTLGTNGNTVTLKPSSGTTQSITVPYATYASSATTVTRTETNPTQYTTYNLIWNTGSTGLGWNDGLSYATLQGTTSVEGHAYLNVGNNIATGTTGNKTGVIRLYSEAGGYAAIKSNSTITGNVTVNIKTSGTVGAFTSAPTSGQVVITDGTDGGIKTLGYTIAKSVPSDAVFTDHYAWTDITGKPSSFTPASHTHGNIQNGGTLQTNDITIASGDKLVVTDSSDSSKVARASISFDGSTTTKCLTQKGTWATFGTSNLTLGTTASTALKGDTKYAGASTAGGSATSAAKLDTSTAGSATQPCYFANGVPSACTYSLNKTVPSDAVFTDTNNAVTQTATITSANYELLFSATADNTTRTEGARKTDSLKYNPSTKEMTLDGTIVLNGYARTTSTDPCPSLILKANNIDTDTAVTARVWGNSELNAHDKDGDRIGFINWFKDADGSIGVAFAAQNKSTGGTSYHNTLEMRVDKTGNRAYSVTDTKAFRTAINDTSITFTKSTTALRGNIGVTRKGNVCTITIGNQITTAGTYTQLGTISPKPAMTTHFLVALDSALRIMRIQSDGTVVFNNATAVSANAWLIGSCTYITAD